MELLSLIERQLTARPDALAITHGARRLTCRQLHAKAATIAHGLRQHGVQPGSLVALYLHRSPELLAALLAIWQLGAAYLPLDPAHPSERTLFMLQDSGAGFVLSEPALLASLPAGEARVLDLYRFAPQSAGPPTPPPAAASLAYVIYTSGSTGKPKGAMISHGSLANTIHGLQRDLQLQPGDVMLASNSFAFDISGQEMYLPLITGARIHLVERELAADGPALLQVLRDAGITIMMGLATTYRLLLDAGWQGDPKLQLTVGGEALSLELARLLAERSRALWNHYGPTETSICATSEKIEANTSKITLGRPLENVRVYVLDEQQHPVPHGAMGEIYIGGEGVGLGYLNRPALTAACFLPDPFAGPGARMYKTGDLGALLEDGKLDFLGRADEQVKIRGFRIELQEVEAALEDYPGVHSAVARAIEFGPDDKRLIAFVVAAGADQLVADTQHLRDFLHQSLPDYMVPSEYLVLPSFPMMPNGKVDRRALDAIRLQLLATSPADQVADLVADEGEDGVEAKLQRIWATLLRVRSVRSSDNFFELGGHSVLAARMLLQVEKQLGKKVPLSLLVEHPTIAQLATYLREQPNLPPSLLVAIRATGTRPPLFLAHGVGGSLLTFRELVQALGEDQPVYGLRIPAALEEIGTPNPDRDPSHHLIQRLAAVYVQNMRAIAPQGPYQLAGHSSAGLVVVEVANQLRALGSQVHLLALLDADIAHGAHRERPWASWSALRSYVERNLEELRHASQYGIRELTMRKVNHYKRKSQLWLVRHRPRLLRRFSPAFVAEAYVAGAAHTFLPGPYPGDVVHYVAQDEPRSHQDSQLGWQTQVLGRLETVTFPGGHQSFLVQPYVQKLARHLGSRLYPGVAGFPPAVPAPVVPISREKELSPDGIPAIQYLGVKS